MNLLFSNDFANSLSKHSSIKHRIKNKVDMIIENPITLGEPLKDNLRGFYSCSVKKNFLIIYLYCLVCRKKGDDKIVLCDDCHQCEDDTIKFVDVGPHDWVYKRSKLDK